MPIHQRLLLGLTGALLLLPGCGKSDVSADPKYGFGAIAGTTWKAKVPLDLIKHDDDGTLGIRLATMTYPEYSVLAHLPEGTELRIERLRTNRGDIGGVHAEGWLT